MSDRRDHDASQSASETGINRRRDTRFAGPFDGWRIGLIDTPLRFFDLSRGGCFVDSMHEQTPGTRLTMKIVLPEVGGVTIKGETLYERGGFGFAVRFVDVDEETEHLLDRALARLHAAASPAWQRPFDAATAPMAVPPAEVLVESRSNPDFREAETHPHAGETTSVEHSRASRLGMLGSGYRVLIDGQPVTLINLSLSGVQVLGTIHVTLGQPAIVKIGWPQDQESFTAIARVRWVQQHADIRTRETVHRIGLAFETWDVRQLREIMSSRHRRTPAAAEVDGVCRTR
jgi:hypothetical protein